MQFTTNNAPFNHPVTVDMDLDLVYSNGISTCHMMEPLSLRGINKRCLEELEQSSTDRCAASTNTSNKRSRCNREGSSSQVKGLVEGTTINTSIPYHQQPQQEVRVPKATNYTNNLSQDNKNNNNNNNNNSSHLRFTLDTKMDGCIDELIEYSHYLERNAYGYRDH